MRHIASIQLQNFQSHSNTTVNVAPSGQLTILTGPSDSGKTAILRGLRWLLYNEPQGADFIRVGCEFARVTVGFSDGTKAIRERRKSGRNQYIILPAAGERQVYEGFGTNVPLEVQQVTGVRPVSIGDMEINLNLAEQLDGPFLGKMVSAGMRAKVLGKLAGTEEIDLAGKVLGTDLYRRNQDEKRLTGEVARLEEQVREYDYLPGMAAKIAALEGIVAKVKAAQERRGLLSSIADKIFLLNQQIAYTEQTLDFWKGIPEAEAAIANAEKQMERQGTLGSLQSQHDAATDKINQNNELLFRWRSLPGIINATARAQEATERRGVLCPLGERARATAVKIDEMATVLEQWRGLPEIEKLAAKITDAESRRGPLSTLWTRLFFTDGLIRDQEFLLKKYVGVAEAENVFRKAAEAAARLRSLIDFRQSLSLNWVTTQMVNKQLVRGQKKLASVRSVEIAESAMVQRKALFPLMIQLKGVDDFVLKSKTTAKIYKQQVAENEALYQDELMAAGQCPVCGSETNQMRIKEVV